MIEVRGVQTHNLVPAVGQVDPEHTHALEHDLHGGQQVVQHSRLQKMKKPVKPQQA